MPTPWERMAACDTLHRAVVYLAEQFKLASDGAEMRANLGARNILVDIQMRVLDSVKIQMRGVGAY